MQRMLHTMLRVGDMQRSIDFYTQMVMSLGLMGCGKCADMVWFSLIQILRNSPIEYS